MRFKIAGQETTTVVTVEFEVHTYGDAYLYNDRYWAPETLRITYVGQYDPSWVLVSRLQLKNGGRGNATREFSPFMVGVNAPEVRARLDEIARDCDPRPAADAVKVL